MSESIANRVLGGDVVADTESVMPNGDQEAPERWWQRLSNWGGDLLDVCLPPTCVLCHGGLASGCGWRPWGVQGAQGVQGGQGGQVNGLAGGTAEARWLTAWGLPLELAASMPQRQSPRRFLCDECLVILAGAAIRSGCWRCGRPLPCTDAAPLEARQPSEDLGESANELLARQEPLNYEEPLCCQRCRGDKSAGELEGMIPLGRYSDVLREGVVAAKRSSCAPLAMVLGNLLGWTLRARLPQSEFDVVTYVPSHWTRRLHRGGWPTRLIAGQVGQLMDVPVRPLLKMVRRTKKQGMLDDKERRKNVLDAFTVRRGMLPRGSRILLVDDVWTTGSTIREAARALSLGFDATVSAAVVARAIGAHDG